MHNSSHHEHRWGVILEGGDGVCLQTLTRLFSGDDRPKQCCSLLGEETLHALTRHRVAQTVPLDRTLLVLTKAHEPFHDAELADVPTEPDGRAAKQSRYASRDPMESLAPHSTRSARAGLVGIGIPKDSVVQYEVALKTDQYLLVVHDNAAQVGKARDIIGTYAAHPFGAALGRNSCSVRKVAFFPEWEGKPMLSNAKGLDGFTIRAADGELGTVDPYDFDHAPSALRCLPVETAWRRHT